MQPPRVHRYVDNIAVLEPRFYPDQGPPGYFPELQFPTQTRLGFRWNDTLSKNTYIQLNAVFITGIDQFMEKHQVVSVFDKISTQTHITLFQTHAKRNDLTIAILEFPTAHQAEEAISFVNTHRRLFGRGPVYARYADVHASGSQAGSTRDILLVREEFALSPPYTPVSQLPSPPIPHSQAPGRWNASGFSRDSFLFKRPHERDHWSPSRKKRDINGAFGSTAQYTPPLPQLSLSSIRPATLRQGTNGCRRLPTHFSDTPNYSDQPKIKRNSRWDAPACPPATDLEPSLLYRIDTVGSPVRDEISSCPSDNDLERALNRSLALADAEQDNASERDDASRGYSRDAILSPLRKRRYFGQHQTKKERKYKPYHKHGKPRDTDRQSDYRSRDHHHHHYRHPKYHSGRQLRYRSDNASPVPGAMELAPAAFCSPVITTTQLDKFKHHFAPLYPCVGVQGDRAEASEPKFIAVSADGQELIIASSKEGAEHALGRPGVRGEQGQLDVEVDMSDEEDESVEVTFNSAKVDDVDTEYDASNSIDEVMGEPLASGKPPAYPGGNVNRSEKDDEFINLNDRNGTSADSNIDTRIMSISELGPSVRRMIGLEQRWTLRGQMGRKWNSMCVSTEPPRSSRSSVADTTSSPLPTIFDARTNGFGDTNHGLTITSDKNGVVIRMRSRPSGRSEEEIETALIGGPVADIDKRNVDDHLSAMHNPRSREEANLSDAIGECMKPSNASLDSTSTSRSGSDAKSRWLIGPRGSPESGSSAGSKRVII